MLVKIFAIKDNKVGGFMQPFFMQNDVLAVRSMQMMMMNSKMQLTAFPEDFDMYELGSYDDETGKIDSILPRFVYAGVKAAADIADKVLQMKTLENAANGVPPELKKSKPMTCEGRGL